MTNFERLKRKDINGMTEFIYEILSRFLNIFCCNDEENCKNNIRKWLESEAVENGE